MFILAGNTTTFFPWEFICTFYLKTEKKKRRKPALDRQEEREDPRNRSTCGNRNTSNKPEKYRK